MRVINLFGGPGIGKSTTAAALFALMKHRGHCVELVTEYAKDLVYDGNTRLLEDQLYVLAKQNIRLSRLRNHVDWAITDSPLTLSKVYHAEDWLMPAIDALYAGYDNVEFLLERVKPFKQYGRVHNATEAMALDSRIARLVAANAHVIRGMN